MFKIVVPRYSRHFIDTFYKHNIFGEMDRLLADSMGKLRLKDSSHEFPTIKDNKFNLDLDMKGFEPADISIKLNENALVVSGKREISKDNGSYEYREFSRVCTVPENVQAEQLKCKLDQNTGMLRIEAPVKPKELNEPRTIPIELSNPDSSK